MAGVKVSFACLALICMVVVVVVVQQSLPATAHFTCCEIKNIVDKCSCYVKTGGDTIPMDCCFAAKALYDRMLPHHDRQAACRCIQDAARSIGSELNVTAYDELPYRCGIPLTQRFGYTMDCERMW